MIYVGIDNGLDGALVAISAARGQIIDKIIMPTKAKAKGREVDTLAVWTWISMRCDHTAQITVLLETPGKHSPGVMALCSMWDSYGALRGMLEVKGIRHHRIMPQSWQKVILGNVEKGNTKPAALSKARQLWPSETWLKSTRSSKDHDGMIDAALIAEYGRLKNL